MQAKAKAKVKDDSGLSVKAPPMDVVAAVQSADQEALWQELPRRSLRDQLHGAP